MRRLEIMPQDPGRKTGIQPPAGRRKPRPQLNEGEKTMKTTCWKILGAALTSLLYAGTAFGQAAVPFNFTPGTPARAAEVNSNFQAHSAVINANSAAIGANKFLRVVLVKPVPGNPLAGGTALLNAMAGITDATSANPYVILLEPGVYDMGGSSLVMKPFVTVRGFGNLTQIKVSIDSPSSGGLAGLNIQNTGGGTNSIGLYYNAVTSGGLRNVKVVGSGATNNFGVYLDNSSELKFSHLEAVASGGSITRGIYLQATSKVTLKDSSVVAGAPTAGSTSNNGIYTDSSSLVVVNSEITAIGTGNTAIFHTGTFVTPTEIHDSRIRATGGFSLSAPAPFIVRVAMSLLEGPKTGAATFNCVGAYTPTFIVFLPSTC